MGCSEQAEPERDSTLGLRGGVSQQVQGFVSQVGVGWMAQAGFSEMQTLRWSSVCERLSGGVLLGSTMWRRRKESGMSRRRRWAAQAFGSRSPIPRDPRIKHRLSRLNSTRLASRRFCRAGPGWGFFSRLNRGRTDSKPTWLLAEFSFLEAVGRTASVSCQLLAEGLPNTATGFVKASKEGSLLRRQM